MYLSLSARNERGIPLTLSIALRLRAILLDSESSFRLASSSVRRSATLLASTRTSEGKSASCANSRPTKTDQRDGDEGLHDQAYRNGRFLTGRRLRFCKPIVRKLHTCRTEGSLIVEVEANIRRSRPWFLLDRIRLVRPMNLAKNSTWTERCRLSHADVSL